ncbi:hypothetical protein OC834_004265 [Tilletia horrida]|nr:hypothetical protein OC834_004265 [Tilletia horrida]
MLPNSNKRNFSRASTNVGSSSYPIATTQASGRLAEASTSAASSQSSDSSQASTSAAGSQRFSSRTFKRTRTEPAIPSAPPPPPKINMIRTVPNEVMFKIVDKLSLQDTMAFAKALPHKVRPILEQEDWAYWRKQLVGLQDAERDYDQLINDKIKEQQRKQARGNNSNNNNNNVSAALPAPPSQEATQSGFELASQVSALYERRPQSKEEKALCDRYKEALVALNLTRVPSTLDELLLALESCTSGTGQGVISSIPQAYVRDFGRSLILGSSHSAKFSNAPFCAFDHLDHPKAAELLSCVSVFLMVLRISSLASEQRQGSTTRTARWLEADCLNALDNFFRPRILIPPPGSTSKLTSEQQAFVDTDIYQGQVIKIQAFAGTGKTTSLIEYARMRPDRGMLYLAFNRAASDDAAHKFPLNVECRTFHSFAYPYKPPNSKVGTIRASDIVDKHLGERLPKGKKKGVAQTVRNLNIAPTAVASYISTTLDNFMSSADQELTIDHIPWRLSKNTTLDQSEVLDCAKLLWKFILAGRDDKGNMVLCPHDAYVKMLHLRGPMNPDPLVSSDILMIDEAQDMSLCQIEILKRTFPQWGGTICVGDTHQRIYGFRGASSKLFDDSFIPPTRSFRLTQSFRFGQKVAETATTLVRLKALPSWETNRTKPLLSGLKSVKDEVYWANNNTLSQLLANLETLVPPQLVWPPAAGPPQPAAEPEVVDDSEYFSEFDTMSFIGDELLGDEPAEPSTQSTSTGTTDAGTAESDDEDDEALGDATADAAPEEPVPLSSSTFQPIKHTRIYRTNARLFRDAMALSVQSQKAGRKIKVFLKTNASMKKDSLLQLLRDAYDLFHGRPVRRSYVLREFRTFDELLQRVEAEEGSAATNSSISLVASLKDDLRQPNWLQTVESLREQFVDDEESALIVMTTVHQAKGLEWDRVMLGDDFRPSLMTNTTRQTEFNNDYYLDEINHMYVAATRARKELYLSSTFVEWLSVIHGYSRLEVDDTRNDTACPKCNKRDQLFLRRKVRITRKDPLFRDRSTTRSHGGQAGSSTSTPASTVTYLASQHCSECIMTELSARDRPFKPLAADDFIDSVSAIRSVQVKMRVEAEAAAAVAVAEQRALRPSASSPAAAIESDDEGLTADEGEDGALAADAQPEQGGAARLSDIPLLKLTSQAREEKISNRTLVEKNALNADLSACSGVAPLLAII